MSLCHIDMLLLCLIAFGFAGMAFGNLKTSRPIIILLLSAGTIAFISPGSALVCLLLLLFNFPLISHSQKTNTFIICVVLNVLALVAFHAYMLKRSDFTTGLPALLGISYLTLQLIDNAFKVRYRQVSGPMGFISFVSSALYLPKFFSGPIASLPDVARQIKSPVTKSIEFGLNRLLLGLFKKLVLADSIAPIVHSVLDFNDSYPGFTVLTAALLFTLQLYLDFSGYSDMAIGISSLWGIELPENFKFPFRQRSWSAFWKSWHSSLTDWLWQYIFSPLFLYLNRKSCHKLITTMVCALCVFAGMALFNGLLPGFYISAGVVAIFYLGEQVLKIKDNIVKPIVLFFVFSIALMFFRTPGWEGIKGLVANFFNLARFIPANWLKDFWAPLASGGTQHDYFNLTISLLLSLGFVLFERKVFTLFSQNKVNFIAWFVLLLLILFWGVFDGGERFIYMQF